MKGNVQGTGVAIVSAIKKNIRTLKTWTLNCILKLGTRLNTWSGRSEKHSHGTYIKFLLPTDSEIDIIIWQANCKTLDTAFLEFPSPPPRFE